ncbi:MAG: DUF5615 family PIN-like protein [Candidatus Competibacteraceae bacterium]
MRILFDQGTPVPLRKVLKPHPVATVFELGWSTMKDSELLIAAEQSGFTVFVTTDQNLKYQQNFSGKKIAIVVLLSTRWLRIKKSELAIAQTIKTALPGSFIEIVIP